MEITRWFRSAKQITPKSPREVNMRDDLTQIAVVLDRSGSMNVIRDATIAGYNEFVSTQKQAPGRARLRLVQFDDQYQVDYDKELAEVPAMTPDTYVPRGWTALLDAIGRTINEIGASLSTIEERDRPGKVVFVIITDGHENRSKEFTQKQIADMIAHQQDSYKWQFIFLGANQDAILEAAKYNIKADAAMSYSANPTAARNMYKATSSNVRSARLGGSVSFTKEERTSAMVPEKTK